MVNGQKKRGREEDNMEIKLKFQNPESDAVLNNKKGSILLNY